jgi:hypothetical protein
MDKDKALPWILCVVLALALGYFVGQQQTPAPTPRQAYEATKKLLLAWGEGDIKDEDTVASPKATADYIRVLIS